MNGKSVVSAVMDARGMTRTELAERLGYTHPSGVTERLRGVQDMRADTLAKFLEAMDCELVARSKLNDGREWVIGNEEHKLPLSLYPSEICWQTGAYSEGTECEFCSHKHECSGYEGHDD